MTNTPLPFDPENAVQERPTPGTALIHIDPVVDEKVRALGLEVIAIVQQAESRVVLSDADEHDAAGEIALITGLKKAFEEKRKEYTAPLNGYLKDINATFKEYTDPLDRADKMTKGKVLAYRAERGRQRQEEERINRLREEAARAEMQLKGELTEPVNLVEVSPPPPAHYRTIAGDLGKTLTWKFEVVDFALLPDDYKLPDLVKIRKVVIAGATIPGVRAWQEESLRVTAPKQ